MTVFDYISLINNSFWIKISITKHISFLQYNHLSLLANSPIPIKFPAHLILIMITSQLSTKHRQAIARVPRRVGTLLFRPIVAQRGVDQRYILPIFPLYFRIGEIRPRDARLIALPLPSPHLPLPSPTALSNRVRMNRYLAAKNRGERNGARRWRGGATWSITHDETHSRGRLRRSRGIGRVNLPVSLLLLERCLLRWITGSFETVYAVRASFQGRRVITFYRGRREERGAGGGVGARIVILPPTIHLACDAHTMRVRVVRRYLERNEKIHTFAITIMRTTKTSGEEGRGSYLSRWIRCLDWAF